MSSFGPAVYAITDSALAGLEAAARDLLGENRAVVFRTRADNHGAIVRHL